MVDVSDNEVLNEIPDDPHPYQSIKVGRRVRLIREVDRMPDFVAEKGLTGIISHVHLYDFDYGDNLIAVTMDEPLDTTGDDGDGNDIVWTDSHLYGDGRGGDFTADEDFLKDIEFID